MSGETTDDTNDEELLAHEKFAAATVAKSPVRYGESYIDRHPQPGRWVVYAFHEGRN